MTAAAGPPFDAIIIVLRSSRTLSACAASASTCACTSSALPVVSTLVDARSAASVLMLA